MSSSDVHPAELLTHASHALSAALADPDRIPDAALRALIADALRLYAVKAEGGMRTPLPADGGGVTITDAMLAVTDILHALNVQLFEHVAGDDRQLHRAASAY